MGVGGAADEASLCSSPAVRLVPNRPLTTATGPQLGGVVGDPCSRLEAKGFGRAHLEE